MIFDAPGQERGLIASLDPRARILGAVLFAILILFLHRLDALAVSVLASSMLVIAVRMPLANVIWRLALLNGFMLMLIFLLPWSVSGEPVLFLGRFEYSREGFVQALAIALRGNALVLAVSGLVGTMEPVTFAHALERLRVPTSLGHLMLLTVRYIAVIEEEYAQLRRAMAVRAFRMRLDLHTLKSIGYLVGMLLVRALDRSERVYRAMKCRGFAGRFHVVTEFHYRAADAVFAVVLLAAGCGLSWMEWGR